LPKRRETVIPAHDLIQQADSIHWTPSKKV
jgi:hypothetical protein